MPRVWRWAVLGCLGLAFAAPAADPAKLAQARTIYQTNLAKIEKACEEKTQAWPAQYLAALKDLQSRFQKAGDLEGWQAVEREVKRFQTDRKVAKESLVSIPVLLRILQESYVDIEDAYTLQKNQEIVSLTQKYLQHLADLQKELTIAGRMDDAIAVNNEMKAAKEGVKYTAAEFAVADYEARKAAEKPVATEPAAPTPPAGQTETTPTTPAAEPAPDGPTVIHVYASGNKPPVLPGVDFKRLNLRPPKLTSNPKNLVVTASLGTVPDATENEVNLPRATVTTKEIRTKHYVRLTLRTPTGAQPLPNVLVTVQGFITPVRNDPGKKTPQLLGSKHVSLPKLTDETVTLDCPPVTTTRRNVDLQRAFIPDAGSRDGVTFAGIIVTVFEADGKIAYQGCSDASLNELGVTQRQDKPAAGGREALRQRLHEARQEARKAGEALAVDPNNRELQRALQDAMQRVQRAREDLDRADR